MIVRRGEELPGKAPNNHKVHIEEMAFQEARLWRSCSPASGAAARTEEIGEIARIETFQVSETWKVFAPARPRQPKPPRATLWVQTARHLLQWRQPSSAP